MSTIQYVGPAEAVTLGDGTVFERRKPVEVDAEVAKSLLEQDVFERPKPGRKAAAKPKPAELKTESVAPAADEDPASAGDPPQEG